MNPMTTASHMTPNSMSFGSMNSQMMLDNFKSMMLTMTMLKGTTQGVGGSGDSSQSFINAILMMLLVSFIDTIVLHIRNVFNQLSVRFNQYISSQTNSIKLINNITSAYNNGSRLKKSSIIIKIEPYGKNVPSDAIIDALTTLPHAKCIIIRNNYCAINYSEEIEISKGLFAQMVMSSSSNMIGTSTSNTTTTTMTNSSSSLPNENQVTIRNQPQQQAPAITAEKTAASSNDDSLPSYGYIDFYSYTLDMEKLRNELDAIVKNFMVKTSNKLGNNIYYFSEIQLTMYRDANGKSDTSKMPDNMHFTMKKFVTNRSFSNLFGKDIDIIRKRVEFFRDNKDWYDSKGVPYTLGIMASGNPGSGKTSVIKCIANELKRHIINIHLSDDMTKSQIENLFYSEQLHVTQNGKTEVYTIPIDKRIYVLEDVDCQCDIILDRGSETVEQILAKKNAELKKEIDQLKYAMSEMASGKKMVMAGNGKLPELQNAKKDELASQKITLSFLLNLFDGVLETPGRITFMTTNFVDKLDKAFTRPGRIDVISKFGFTDHSQLIAIIEHRYDAKLTEEQLCIINNIHPCITPAEVSRILFENFNDLEGALDGLTKYADMYMLKEKEKAYQQQLALLKAEEMEKVEASKLAVSKAREETAVELAAESILRENM